MKNRLLITLTIITGTSSFAGIDYLSINKQLSESSKVFQYKDLKTNKLNKPAPIRKSKIAAQIKTEQQQQSPKFQDLEKVYFDEVNTKVSGRKKQVRSR